jgi:beta-glucanase (GH16 family)
LLRMHSYRSILCGLGLVLALTGITGAIASVNHRNPAQSSRRETRVSWTEVWADDFAGPEGGAVNSSYWKYDVGTGIFGTGEVETMTDSPSNVRLDGTGGLIIEALKSRGSWTSGRIQTVRDFAPPPGGEMKVTASIELPDPAHGLGYWPAFWLLAPGAWPERGEMDVMEDVNALSSHSSTLHCGSITATSGGPCHEATGLTSGLRHCSGCKTGFHTYSMVIDRRVPGDEQIRWYFDGRQFFSVGEAEVGPAVWTAAVDHGFSIVLNLAIGGNYPNGVCGCTTPEAQTSSRGMMIVRGLAVYDT